MRKIYILRGIPGTGKTTWAYKKLEMLMHKHPHEHHFLLSRDAFRMKEVNYSESEYQKSFQNEEWDFSIKRRFWEYFYSCFEKADVIILDTTMISHYDYIILGSYILRWCMFHTQPEIRWKIFTKEYGSKHSVPEKVMKKYREKFLIANSFPFNTWDWWNEEEKNSHKTKVEYI